MSHDATSSLSLHRWQDGQLASASDAVFLEEADRHGLTLVTRDISSVGHVLDEIYSQGRSHSGVIFVSWRTIPERDVGTLVDALIRYWRAEQEGEWLNRVAFLPR